MKIYSQKSDIKVGVIGYGGAYNMGLKHLSQMKDAGMTPVAVAEIDPTRLESAETDFPDIGRYSSLQQMLEESDVDLVAIITPHNTHAPLALEALAKGKHVICEKPMAITTKEVDAMIAQAEANDALVTTYHNRHWDGIPRTALKLIKEQHAIGSLYKIECRNGWYGKIADTWRASRSISGGILYDWGVHLLEYAFQLIDSPIAEVSGYAKSGHWGLSSQWGEDHIEDEVHATVRFVNGAWLNLTVSQLDPDRKPGMIEFVGTEGSLTFPNPKKKYTLVKWKEGERLVTEEEQPPNEHERFYQNIAGYLTGAEDLVITPEWARRPIHVLELATQSAISGETLKPKYS